MKLSTQQLAIVSKLIDLNVEIKEIRDNLIQYRNERIAIEKDTTKDRKTKRELIDQIVQDVLRAVEEVVKLKAYIQNKEGTTDFGLTER